jgi:hypothetical protein
MKSNQNKKLALIFGTTVLSVFFIIIIIFLFHDLLENWQEGTSGTIAARIATIFVAFCAFVSQTLFNFLIFQQNRSVTLANQDANKRADMFRDVQFISSNYSIIEFMDRMLIKAESPLYVEKYIGAKKGDFHMILNSINSSDLFGNEELYQFVSIRIPFYVVEGKTISLLRVSKITFQRDQKRFIFRTIKGSYTEGFLIYNELTKRRNLIMNLIVLKDSDFFKLSEVSSFSRIKIELTTISILGVSVPGTIELYFKNPEQIEMDSANSYKIISSSFVMQGLPSIERLVAPLN